MTKPFKLIEAFSEQVKSLGPLKRAWFTTFNLNIDFFERHVLSALLERDKPRSRIDFELMQQTLNGKLKETKKSNRKIESAIDVKIFADQRMYDARDVKRTAIETYGVNPLLLDKHSTRYGLFGDRTLFHPKVIYLEDEQGKAILGVGSANLTVSGWSTNQEVFVFKEVEHKKQLDEIQKFFKHLFKPHDLRFLRPNLVAPKQNPTMMPEWQFVHSFQSESFVSQLATLNQAEESFDLVVWSPYFPSDLVGYIEKLQAYWQHEIQSDLRLHLIPDLVENQRMRTKWDDRLTNLVNSEEVCFYRNAVMKDDHSDLCHAKIWMTPTHIAIGSWNFTSSGSNIDLKKKDTQVNIEAGFIMKHHEPELKNVLMKPIENINPSNFMIDNELEEHQLDVPELLPVDISVSFDWKTLEYQITLNWNDSDVSLEGMKLSLPDVSKPIMFELKEVNQPIELTKKLESEPEALLVQHNFELSYVSENKVSCIYRGFILEKNTQMRRVEQFDSLDEIFSNLISGKPLEDNPNAVLRSEFSQNDQDWLQEQDAVSKQEIINRPTISYFRLFQAMENLEQQIINSQSESVIEQYAFVLPGCLAEMKAKIYEEIKENATVFNWYMRQEFNLLVQCASTNVKTKDLQKRIQDLRLKSDDPVVRKSENKNKIGEKGYRKMIKDKCHYVSI